MARVARLNVTPVKSTSLCHPQEIDLGSDGAEGDHLFLFLESDRSRIRSEAKAGLLGIRARFDAATDRVTITFPDGETVAGEARALGEPFEVALFDRVIPVAAVPGPIDAAVSDRLGRAVALARVVPPERAGGARRVSIISLGSVADLGRRGGAATTPDPRRFRMLIELDGCAPYEEDAWCGRSVQIGEARVRVEASMARCVVTTMDPDTGRKDFPALEVLAAYRRRDREVVIGVAGDVERPGRVRVGDPVHLVA